MKNNKIAIIGTGGFAEEVLFLLNDMGRLEDVCCFYDSDEGWEKNWKDKELLGKPVFPQSQFDPDLYVVSVAIGNPQLREKVVKALPEDTRFETLIHPLARVSPWATLGQGAIICCGSVVTANIVIGEQCHLNLLSVVGHDAVIGDYFTTATHAIVNGNCKIGNRVYFGSHAGIRQGVSVCDDVVLGMGAMGFKDITESGVYVGCPAKKIK